MTDRAEIERLLNQTGRTLEGLPTEEGYLSADDCAERYRSIGIAMQGSRFRFNVPFMIHQSDVIELLVGALRDALEDRTEEISDAKFEEFSKKAREMAKRRHT